MSKRYFLLCSVFVIAVVLLAGCATASFDRSLLESSGIEVTPRLPRLEFKKAESTQIGSENSVTSSSYAYTIFRREIENNICDMSTENNGQIEIELIFVDVVQKPGWTSKNEATIEYEVRIKDKAGETIWDNIYSGTKNCPDPGLVWQLQFSNSSANNAIASLLHDLLEEMKTDIQNDRSAIISKL